MEGHLRILAIASLSVVLCCDPNQVQPIDAARTYSKNLGLKVLGADCAGSDTDHDGYVSCGVNVDDGDSRSHVLSLQCAAFGAEVARGCKPTDAKTPTVRP